MLATHTLEEQTDEDTTFLGKCTKMIDIVVSQYAIKAYWKLLWHLLEWSGLLLLPLNYSKRMVDIIFPQCRLSIVQIKWPPTCEVLVSIVDYVLNKGVEVNLPLQYLEGLSILDHGLQAPKTDKKPDALLLRILSQTKVQVDSSDDSLENGCMLLRLAWDNRRLAVGAYLLCVGCKPWLPAPCFSSYEISWYKLKTTANLCMFLNVYTLSCGVHVDIIKARLSVSSRDAESDMSPCTSEKDWLMGMMCPLSLKHLCRAVTRKQLLSGGKRPLTKAINNLPLPKEIINFMKMKEIIFDLYEE